MQRYYNSQADLALMNYEELTQLNANPFAYFILINNPEYIIWDIIPYNSGNWHIYTCHPEQISWRALHLNPRLGQLVRRDINAIDWRM
jgi:hypothetical protein